MTFQVIQTRFFRLAARGGANSLDSCRGAGGGQADFVWAGGNQEIFSVHLFHVFNKSLEVHFWCTMTVTQSKGGVDRTAFHIPDFVVVQIVAPFVET